MTESKGPETLEEALARLDRILERLENEENSLEESFTWYQEGLKLVKYADTQIDRIEKQCMLVDEEGELHEF
ncbi:MAG: exodeoxyribonuclease VII small subunit [Lachnospiraceae bacterium]|nr:exodeoxyribonuclease VII small subunit [Lachnospiraceae bacterium]